LVQTSTDDPLAPVDFTGLRGGFSEDTLAYTGVIVAGADGDQDVLEMNAEFVLPLLQDAPFARYLELNGGVRHTDYSTSGSVVTWKAGIGYQPTEEIRTRFIVSRDIRAPTLYDLFAATQIRN